MLEEIDIRSGLEGHQGTDGAHHRRVQNHFLSTRLHWCDRERRHDVTHVELYDVVQSIGRSIQMTCHGCQLAARRIVLDLS